jgi:ATP-dependent RNA helicase DDX18/HAS1
MLFSATTTPKTEALTRLALKKEPVYVGVDDDMDKATVEGLEQGLSACHSLSQYIEWCWWLHHFVHSFG